MTEWIKVRCFSAGGKTYQVIAGFWEGLQVGVIVLQLGEGQFLLSLQKKRGGKQSEEDRDGELWE